MMPDLNDMENVGVSRVDAIDDAEPSDGGGSLGEKAGKKAVKRAVDKRNEKKKNRAKSDDESLGKKGASKPSDVLKDAVGDKPDGGEEDVGSDIKNAGKNLKRAGAAANAGVKGAIFMKFMNMMHMAMAMLNNFAGGIASIGQGFFGFIGQVAGAIGAAAANFFGGVTSLFSGAVSFVSSALGIGAAASTATVATVGITGALAVGIAVGGVLMSTNNVAQRDGRLIDCREVVAKAEAGLEVDADAQQLKNAQMIYSVLSTYGLSDEHIAGVLGNWTAESGIDPTKVEGLYGEDYNIQGPKHQEAMKDWDAYVKGPLSDGYAGFTGSGGPIKNPGGYTGSDGKMYPGIGMGQYTGGGTMKFITFAEQIGHPWYTVDFQMAYTLAKGAPAKGGPDFWEKYAQQTGSARDLAHYFSEFWEGNTSNGFPARLDYAESWYNKMGDWQVDKAYANSVISFAERIGAVATENNVASKKRDCVQTVNGDNSSIANAAVSFAYETKEEGIGNNGTELFRRVHDYIVDSNLYQSCDITVALAVRWSGSDDTYQLWSTNKQLEYLMTSDKWEEVGMLGDLEYEDLMPGDVLCLEGHTLLFVGTDAVKAKYPNSDGNSVSGSLNQRSAGVGKDTTWYMSKGGCDPSHNNAEYHVFRCVKPDNSTKYIDAGK